MTDLDVRRLVRAFDVDVAVFELVADAWDVAELAAAIRIDCPTIRLVGLHPGRRSDHTARSTAVGVDAMLSYGTGVAGLVAAIRGDEGVSRAPAIDRRVLPAREILTAREREVLLHISAGYTTQQSAQLLSLSPKTVDNHKQRMFAKLDVQNQAHAVAVAHRPGSSGRRTGSTVTDPVGATVVLGRRGLTRDVVRHALETVGVTTVDLVAFCDDPAVPIVAVLVNPSDEDWTECKRLDARIVYVGDRGPDAVRAVDSLVRGADAVLDSDIEIDELVEVIATVAAGMPYLSPAQAAEALDRLRRGPSPAPELPALTPGRSTSSPRSSAATPSSRRPAICRSARRRSRTSRVACSARSVHGIGPRPWPRPTSSGSSSNPLSQNRSRHVSAKVPNPPPTRGCE